MATIEWASGVSGTWATATDWSGGVVPGNGDTAVINAEASGDYTITVTSPVAVAGLDLDQTAATLLIDKAFLADEVSLQSGTLELSKGSLEGTVAATGGLLLIGLAGGTLSGVTWQGALDPAFKYSKRGSGVLTISHSLSLTGADGSGSGTASFYGSVVLNALQTLDDATLGGGSTLTVEGSPMLTFGAGLVENLSVTFNSSQAETLVNDGLIASTAGSILTLGDTGSTTGSLINDGTLSGNLTIALSSVTNDGLIEAAHGQTITLDATTLTAPGSNGSIVLESANLIVGGTLTTAALQSLYASQHVSVSGSYGFGSSGVLDNTGNTLQIGPGSTFGTLDGMGEGTLTGGTVVDLGGEGPLIGGQGLYSDIPFTLMDLNYSSDAPTLTLENNWALTNIDLSGVSTLDQVQYPGNINGQELLLTGGTLSGLGTLNITGVLTMDGTTISDPSGHVTLNIAAGAFNVTFGATQSLAGYAINAAGGYIQLQEQSIAGVSFAFDPTTPEFVVEQSANGSQTWSSSVKASIAAASVVDFESGTGTLISKAKISAAGTIGVGAAYYEPPVSLNLQNAGDITVSKGGALIVAAGSTLANSGTIAVSGGLLDLQTSGFSDTGSMSVRNGTLALEGGTLTLSALDQLVSEIKLTGSGLVTDASIDLQSGTLAAGQAGIPQNLTLGQLETVYDGSNTGTLSDGTLLVSRGVTTVVRDNEYLSVAVVNNGTLALSSLPGEGYSNYAYFQDAVSGSGTIALTAGSATEHGVGFASTVGAGQTLDILGSGSVEIGFANAAASVGFAGTLGGFAVGDGLQFGGETISSARFVGSSIVVTLAAGGTISLATTSALSGSLTVEYGNLVQYTGAGLDDWSGVHNLATAPAATWERSETVAVWLRDEHLPGDWLLPGHGLGA